MPQLPNSSLRKWILAFVLLVLSGGASLANAQGFTEYAGFGGKVVRPSTGPIVGLGFGIGTGKNLLSLELTHNSLDNYRLGEGTSVNACTTTCNSNGVIIPPFQDLFSDSAAVTLTGNFARSLVQTRRFSVYATAGGGYLKTRANGNRVNCPLCEANGLLTPYYVNGATSVIVGGGGVRIPIAKGIGFRAEAKYEINHSTDDFPRDHIIGLTFGLYYRRFVKM